MQGKRVFAVVFIPDKNRTIEERTKNQNRPRLVRSAGKMQHAVPLSPYFLPIYHDIAKTQFFDMV